jgi:hypothetical protein
MSEASLLPLLNEYIPEPNPDVIYFRSPFSMALGW